MLKSKGIEIYQVRREQPSFQDYIHVRLVAGMSLKALTSRQRC